MSTSQPVWGGQNTLKAQGKPLMTGCVPAVAAHKGRVYSVWSDSGNKKLNYKIFEDKSGTLEELKDSSPGAGTVAQIFDETALTSPTIAVAENVIHAVFPDGDGNLVHIMYNETLRAWCRKSGMRSSTKEIPALATFRGKLYCVYTAGDTKRLTMQSWEDKLGWSDRIDIKGISNSNWKGPFAIFELFGCLQMMMIDGATRRVQIWRFSDDLQNPVLQMNKQLQDQRTSASGVSAACVYSEAFIAFVAPVSRRNTIQFNEYWQQKGQERQLTFDISDSSPNITPSLTISNNTIYCFWIDKSGLVCYVSRRALDIPHLDAWMSGVTDKNKLISQLTIPGIHDAAALVRTNYTKPLTFVPWVQCQSLTIDQLLRAGVRYIDLRCGYAAKTDKTLFAFHGPIPIYDVDGNWLRIDSILKDCYKFLEEHPSEGLIIQMKQDGPDKKPDADFAQDVSNLVSDPAHKPYWLCGNTVPTLQVLQKKIQLVRRIPLPQKLPLGETAFGIDATEWDKFTFKVGDITVQIQDDFSFSSPSRWKDIPDTKFGLVQKYLNDAVSSKTPKTWYINFTSANGAPYAGPDDIALGWVNEIYIEEIHHLSSVTTDGVNKKVATFFNDTAPPGAYGTIVMDFPEDPSELIIALLASNKLLFSK